METILLRLPARADGALQWALIDAGGAPRALHQGGAQELAAQAQGRRLLALAPGEQVLLTGVEIPSRSQRQLRRAVPYALEDELAQDVDELFFALGPRTGGRTPVAVVERGRMQAWVEGFQAWGLRPQALLPECLRLPLEPGRWTVLCEGERCLVRTGVTDGFYAERAWLAELLAAALQALEEETRPQGIALWSDGEAPPPGLDGLAVPVEVKAEGVRALEVLAATRERPPLDLLQEEFSQREALSRHLRPWRAVAVLAGLALLLAMLNRGLEIHRLSAEVKGLNEAITAVYREAFPEARRIVDPRVQMEQQLRSLKGAGESGQGGFLRLLDVVSAELAGSPNLQVTGLSYRDGRLDLSLSAPSAQSLDELRQRLAAKPGLQAELQSVSTEGETASGQLRLTRSTA